MNYKVIIFLFFSFALSFSLNSQSVLTDYSTYIGLWNDKTEINSNGGSELEITRVQENVIYGFYTSVSSGPQNRTASFEFSGTIKNNTLAVTFSDNFKNTGTAILKFKSSIIEVEIVSLQINPNNTSGWSVKSSILTCSTLQIFGLSKYTNSVEAKNTIFIESTNTGNDYVKIIINNSELLELELIELRYDDNSEKLVEVKTIKKLFNLKNCIVIIKTSIPEGVPFEKIKWKGKSGKYYEYIVTENDTSYTYFHCE